MPTLASCYCGDPLLTTVTPGVAVEGAQELKRDLPHLNIDHRVQLQASGCAENWNSGIRTFPNQHAWIISNHDMQFLPGQLGESCSLGGR